MIRYSFYILFFLLLLGCHSSKREIQKIVSHWAGKYPLSIKEHDITL